MTNDNRICVEDVMSTPLAMTGPDTSLRNAAKTMREKDINALVVTTHPPSIVTSTDVLDAVANGSDVTDVTVADVMTESVETIPQDLFLEEVAAMLTTFGIKHLPVTDDDGEYVGMVSSTDVAAQHR